MQTNYAHAARDRHDGSCSTRVFDRSIAYASTNIAALRRLDRHRVFSPLLYTARQRWWARFSPSQIDQLANRFSGPFRRVSLEGVAKLYPAKAGPAASSLLARYSWPQFLVLGLPLLPVLSREGLR